MGGDGGTALCIRVVMYPIYCDNTGNGDQI